MSHSCESRWPLRVTSNSALTETCGSGACEGLGQTHHDSCVQSALLSPGWAHRPEPTQGTSTLTFQGALPLLQDDSLLPKRQAYAQKLGGHTVYSVT